MTTYKMLKCDGVRADKEACNERRDLRGSTQGWVTVSIGSLEESSEAPVLYGDFCSLACLLTTVQNYVRTTTKE